MTSMHWTRGAVWLALLAAGWLPGCKQCGRSPETAPAEAARDARPAEPVARPEPPPPAPDIRFTSRAGAELPPDDPAVRKRLVDVYEPGTVPLRPGEPLGLVKMPAVSPAEIEADKKLSGNPNLLPAHKKTLKVLQKLTQTDPRFSPDRPMSGPPESPPDKP